MTQEIGRGGEADSARLLELARRELLDGLLPQLEGDARYRARLIAKAMKIAANDLHGGAAGRETAARLLLDLAAELPEVAAADRLPDAAASLAAEIRTGRLDGQGAVYDLLCRLTEARRATLD
ncbi:MAG: DUF6285 domain-containing protein [Kiloniellaceae bacterium]